MKKQQLYMPIFLLALLLICSIVPVFGQDESSSDINQPMTGETVIIQGFTSAATEASSDSSTVIGSLGEIFIGSASADSHIVYHGLWSGASLGSPGLCGDANGDGDVNVSDAVWIINFVFVNGDPPEPLSIGDANCDTEVNVSDAVWIINFVFVNGNDPCDTDGDQIPDC